MKLKTIEHDGKTFAEVIDGKPVYEIEGKDTPFDAEHAQKKIATLNFEAQGHREQKEKLEKALKGFEGIEDPEAALKAIETLKNIDDSKLIDAKKVEEIKAAAIRATEEKMEAALKAKDAEIAQTQTERDTLKSSLDKELIGGNFARSKWIDEKIAIPADLLQARFGQNFKVEEGKLVAYDTDGKPIYSSAKPGEIATFDEAIEHLVHNYPQRDNILKGRQHNGHNSGNNGNPGDKTMSRADFEKLDHSARTQKMSEGYTLYD